MKKQKLTRKSLDELAQIMPVLSEDEQRNCKPKKRKLEIERSSH